MMCPDKRLISVYIDGELDSPWKEKLEQHCADCASCAAIAGRYRSISASLASVESLAEKAVLDRMSRRSPDFTRSPAGIRTGSIRKMPPFWQRAVSLPIPLVTAAALIMTLLAGIAFSGYRFQSKPDQRSMATATQAVINAHPASFEALVKSIDTQSGDSSMTIRLPTEAAFPSTGEPVLIAASAAGGFK